MNQKDQVQVMSSPIPDFYKLVRQEVEREANQINQRVTWLLTSQAILFGGLGFLLTANPRELPEGALTTANRIAILIPILGFLLSVLVLCGFVGAYLALLKLRQECTPLLQDRRRRLPSIFKSGLSLWLGGAASCGTCVVLLIAWLTVILSLR